MLERDILDIPVVSLHLTGIVISDLGINSCRVEILVLFRLLEIALIEGVVAPRSKA